MNMRYLKDRLVAARYGVSRATIWRWVSEGIFPAPVKLTKGCTRWRESDLLMWEEAIDAEEKESCKR